jgi:hypothetical protein
MGSGANEMDAATQERLRARLQRLVARLARSRVAEEAAYLELGESASGDSGSPARARSSRVPVVLPDNTQIGSPRPRGRLPNPPPTERSLEYVVHTLDEALSGNDHPAEFSPASLERLAELHAAYVEEVGSAAIRQARRNGGDVVSVVDIESGDRAVRSEARHKTWAESIGGILAGAGIGTFIQVALEAHPSTLGLSLSASMAAIGLVTMTAAHFARQH